MNRLAYTALPVLVALTAAVCGATPERKMNVLLISADDMRPQLGCYGDGVMKSPHLDRLASRGLVFNRAYCQQALCSPSRISLLSGRYPATTGIYTIGPFLREKLPDVVTLPQHFKANGYHTRSLGKVYHVGIDDPASWSEPPFHSKKPRYGPRGREMVQAYTRRMKADGKAIPQKGKGAAHYAGPAFEAPGVEDDALLDGDTAREAVAALKAYAGKPGQPFFLAVGFANPHVPWVAPKKYFDLYNAADLKLPTNDYPPKGAPAFAAQTGADFTFYAGAPESGKPDAEYGRQCLQAYLAAISYVDAQVGRLLETLEQTGLAENTVVVYWSDHGYYMGEHGWWGGKHNNYEGATRVPLIVSVPGQKSAGKKTDALVELVDLYPTLAETCRLPASQGTEGTSFKRLLDDPGRPWKKAAFSWYPKGGRLGVAMRTDRYRYVEWAAKAGAPAAVELYDHQSDPQENVNVADRAENRQLLDELKAQMRAGWAGARP